MKWLCNSSVTLNFTNHRFEEDLLTYPLTLWATGAKLPILIYWSGKMYYLGTNAVYAEMGYLPK